MVNLLHKEALSKQFPCILSIQSSTKKTKQTNHTYNFCCAAPAILMWPDTQSGSLYTAAHLCISWGHMTGHCVLLLHIFVANEAGVVEVSNRYAGGCEEGQGGEGAYLWPMKLEVVVPPW